MAFERMHEFISFLEDRKANGYDNLVGVSGKRRKGKSTNTIQLIWHNCEFINKLNDFDLEKNIAYTQKEAIEKLVSIETGGIIQLDEGIRAFYKRNWNKSEQKDLNILINEIGVKKLTCYINIPDILDMDKDIRKHFEIWLLVPERGKVMVFLHDENAFTPDPWHMEENRKRIARYYKGPRDGIKKLMEGYRHTINYMGEFEVPKIPKEIEKKYEILSKAAKQKYGEMLVLNNDKEVKPSIRLQRAERTRNNGIIYLHEQLKMQSKEIAKAFELDTDTINEIVRTKQPRRDVLDN